VVRHQLLVRTMSDSISRIHSSKLSK
jgi:hypothetical protein